MAGSTKKKSVWRSPDDFDNPLDVTKILSEKDSEKNYGDGSLAGKIVMSDDFDEPLEDLEDYM